MRAEFHVFGQVLLSLSLVGCHSAEPAPDTPVQSSEASAEPREAPDAELEVSRLGSRPPYDSRIFAPNSARATNLNARPPTWRPSEAECDALEARIHAGLAAIPELSVDGMDPISGRELANGLSSYFCQYSGITIDGKRAIHCNFVATEFADRHDATRRWLTVSGGGWRFWQINYLVDEKRFLDVCVNSSR